MYKINNIRFLFTSMLLALVFPKAYVNYVPATEGTLATKGASALQKTIYDSQLRNDTTLDEIWDRVTDVVDVSLTKIQIPQSVFMKFPTPPRGTNRAVFQMTGPLKEAFKEGDSEYLLGNEEEMDLFHLTIRMNEIKKAVKSRGWGTHFEDIDSTGLYRTINPKFIKAWKEYRGKRIRVASMLRIEDALTKSPVSMKQQFCANIFIPNLDLGDMPTYDITDLTVTAGSEDALGYYPDRTFSGADSFVESIAARMLEASGTTSTPKAYMDTSNLDELVHHVTQNIKMPPHRMGNGSGYLFVISSEDAAYLTSPTNTNSMGSLWRDTTALTSEEQSFPGMLGKYKSLWFVMDPKSPTLTVSGSSGSYALQPGFVDIGDTDNRNNSPWGATSGSLNYVFNVGFVYGDGALAEWIVYDPQYAKESTEYEQIVGKASYMMGGIQTAEYDVDTPDDENDSGGTAAGKTLIQKSICMVLTSRVSIATRRSTT